MSFGLLTILCTYIKHTTSPCGFYSSLLLFAWDDDGITWCSRFVVYSYHHYCDSTISEFDLDWWYSFASIISHTLTPQCPRRHPLSPSSLIFNAITFFIHNNNSGVTCPDICCCFSISCVSFIHPIRHILCVICYEMTFRQLMVWQTTP